MAAKKWERSLIQSLEEARRAKQPATLDDFQSTVVREWYRLERVRRDNEGFTDAEFQAAFRFILERRAVTTAQLAKHMDWGEDEAVSLVDHLLDDESQLLMETGTEGKVCFTHAGHMFTLQNDPDLHQELLDKFEITEVKVSVDYIRELQRKAGVA